MSGPSSAPREPIALMPEPPLDELTRLKRENEALVRVCDAAADLSDALFHLRPSDRSWPTKTVMEPIWKARAKVEEAVGLYTLVRYRHRLNYDSGVLKT